MKKLPATTEKKMVYTLPFLQILSEMSPNQRTIILGHLDQKSCETLCSTIRSVVKSTKLKKQVKNQLQKHLTPHKACLRSLCKTKTFPSQRRSLQKLGGNPLMLILASALPLLLNKLAKK